MALVFREECRDFIDGEQMTIVKSMETPPDIHHIFPRAYCEKTNLDRARWNSIVNKTPLTYSTNREIGGAAPSAYLKRIEKKGQVSPATLDQYLESHLIGVSACRGDSFDAYFIRRAAALLDRIEAAAGKPIAGRDSEPVVQAFGGPLL